MDRDDSTHIQLENGAKIVKSGIVEKYCRGIFFSSWVHYQAIIDEQNNLYLYRGDKCEYKISLVDTHIQYLSTKESFGKPYAFTINNFTSSSYASFRKRCFCFSSSQDGPQSNNIYAKKMLLLAAISESDSTDWVDIVSAILRKGQLHLTSHEYESFNARSLSQSLPPVNAKKLKQSRLEELRRKESHNNEEDEDENKDEENNKEELTAEDYLKDDLESPTDSHSHNHSHSSSTVSDIEMISTIISSTSTNIEETNPLHQH